MTTGSSATPAEAVVRHTGPGPVGGTDIREAAGIVVGECPDLPFLPLLADRGTGADQTGRTAATLVDLPVDLSPRGWRLADRRGRAARHAADLMDRDVDALEEAWERSRGAVLDRAGQVTGDQRRVQMRVTGPWTLGARVELPGGRLVVTDRGAVRDLAASLLDGVAHAAARLAARLEAPCRIVLDEPDLWAVIAGTVPGPSDFDPIPAVSAERASTALRRFASGLRDRGVAEVLVRVPGRPVHGPAVPWRVLVGPSDGEDPFDGLVLDSLDLLPRGDRRRSGSPEHEAPRDARAVAALDAAGTALGEGLLLQLEGAHRLAGLTTAPRGPAEVERAASGVLELLDRLAAPRWATLARIEVSPAESETSGGGVVTALAGAARLAATLPTMAR